MNAATHHQKGARMPAASVITTLVVGCTVRQTLTDQYTNGTFAMPNSATPADSLSDPGPPYRRSSRYARKIIQSTSVDVSRASHCHQTPQALRAQSGPVMSTIAPKSTDSSAAASAQRSARRFSLNRNSALAMPQTNADTNIAIAAGTWK